MNHFPDSQPSGSNSTHLVEGILAADERSMELLFGVHKRGLVGFFARRFGSQDAEDLAAETLMIVCEAIRAQSIREPERLSGFVLTVARRLGFRLIEQRTTSRQRERSIDHDPVILNEILTASESPEHALLRIQRQSLMLKVLRELSKRDREVLERFYLHEESPEKIQAEMGMTETQFRLTKNRAKARFGSLGQQLMTKPIVRRTVQSAGKAFPASNCA
jgi:RNA polymerase sigma factor (sigma-70 family)